MTKNERDFIVSTIAGKPRDVSTEAFVELNHLLYEASIDKTCENCKYGFKEPDTKILCRQSFHITDDYCEDLSLSSFVFVDDNFGCNLFRVKSNE